MGSLNLIQETRRIVSRHFITDAVYSVHPDGVYKDDVRIYFSPTPIAGSCICQSTLALRLVSGHIVLLKSLVMNPEVSVANTIITAYSSSFRQIAASPCGRYIVSNNAIRSVSIFEVENKELKLIGVLPRDSTQDNPLSVLKTEENIVVFEANAKLIAYVYGLKTFFDSTVSSYSLLSKGARQIELVGSNKCFVLIKNVLKRFDFDDKFNIIDIQTVFEDCVSLARCVVYNEMKLFAVRKNMLEICNDEGEFSKVDFTGEINNDFASQYTIRFDSGYFLLTTPPLEGTLQTAFANEKQAVLCSLNKLLLVSGRQLKFENELDLKVKVNGVLSLGYEAVMIPTIKNTTLVVNGDRYNLPKEVNGRVLAAGILNNDVLLAFSDKVEVYSSGELKSTTKVEHLLNAKFVKNLGLILQFTNKVEVFNGKVLVSDVVVTGLEVNNFLNEFYVMYTHPKTTVDLAGHIDVKDEKYGVGYLGIFSSQNGELLKTYSFNDAVVSFLRFENDNAVALFQSLKNVYTFNLKKEGNYVVEHVVDTPVKFGYAGQHHAVLYGTQLFHVSSSLKVTKMVVDKLDSKSLVSGVALSGYGRTLYAVINNKIVMYTFNSPDTFTMETPLAVAELPFADDLTSVHKEYRFVEINQVNAVAVNRAEFCKFYDIDTLNELTVEGLNLDSYSSISVYKNEIAITQQTGHVETFTVSRKQNTVTCKSQRKLSVFKVHTVDLFFDDMVSFVGSKILVSRCHALVYNRNTHPSVCSIIDLESGEALKKDEHLVVGALSSILNKYFVAVSKKSLRVLGSNMETITSLDLDFIPDMALDEFNVLAFATGELNNNTAVITATLQSSLNLVPAGPTIYTHFVVILYDAVENKLTVNEVDPFMQTYWDMPKNIRFLTKRDDKLVFNYVDLADRVGTYIYE